MRNISNKALYKSYNKAIRLEWANIAGKAQ
jgi:hypothetical protein